MWNSYHEEREVVRCEGIKLLNSEVMLEVEKEGYTYLDIVELDKIRDNEIKEKAISKSLKYIYL